MSNTKFKPTGDRLSRPLTKQDYTMIDDGAYESYHHGATSGFRSTVDGRKFPYNNTRASKTQALSDLTRHNNELLAVFDPRLSLDKRIELYYAHGGKADWRKQEENQ